ncbi:hypothetical protein SCLCIDRAFT_1217535, partial [Scleroderma citrinum Foug A]
MAMPERRRQANKQRGNRTMEFLNGGTREHANSLINKGPFFAVGSDRMSWTKHKRRGQSFASAITNEGEAPHLTHMSDFDSTLRLGPSAGITRSWGKECFECSSSESLFHRGLLLKITSEALIFTACSCHLKIGM